MRRWWLGVLFVLTGCPASCPGPAPTPASDAGAMTDAGPKDWCPEACANVLALGCSEVLPGNCVAVCRDALAARITPLNPECMAKAKSRAEVRGCGSVRCSEP